jgi:hypothetical protein
VRAKAPSPLRSAFWSASGVQPHNPLKFPFFPLYSHKSLSKLVSHPQKTLNFARQNLRKPQQKPTSSTLVKPEFFLAAPHPFRARRPPATV